MDIRIHPATSSTYTKRDVSKAPEAFKASLEIMFCHMADMFDVVLTVLSEKYGHSKEEMLKTLVAHPSYQSLPRHPVLDSLGYFGEEELPCASASAVAEAEATATATVPKTIVVRRKKLKQKTPITNTE
jgi:hypothetical protein